MGSNEARALAAADPVPGDPCSAAREALPPQLEGGPHAPQLEERRTAAKTQSSQK